jgi:hypothetical protein
MMWYLLFSTGNSFLMALARLNGTVWINREFCRPREMADWFDFNIFHRKIQMNQYHQAKARYWGLWVWKWMSFSYRMIGADRRLWNNWESFGLCLEKWFYGLGIEILKRSSHIVFGKVGRKFHMALKCEIPELSLPENFQPAALPFSLDGAVGLQIHANQFFDFENFRFDVFHCWMKTLHWR